MAFLNASRRSWNEWCSRADTARWSSDLLGPPFRMTPLGDPSAILLPLQVTTDSAPQIASLCSWLWTQLWTQLWGIAEPTDEQFQSCNGPRGGSPPETPNAAPSRSVALPRRPCMVPGVVPPGSIAELSETQSGDMVLSVPVSAGAKSDHNRRRVACRQPVSRSTLFIGVYGRSDRSGSWRDCRASDICVVSTLSRERPRATHTLSSLPSYEKAEAACLAPW
jgi:hypothetical protein